MEKILNRFVNKIYSPRHKIVLICMNLHRELSMLELLKKEIENTLQADVWIIGSLADIQRTYYLLNKIKPDMVFISQIIEKDCREIANYVRKSGAVLCVLPVELTYAEIDYYGLFSNRQPYNKYVDYYFLPGIRMYRDILRLSDINKNKMFITGTPKIDLYINKNAKKSISRRDFCTRYSISKNRKNIFIFTSFVITPVDYIKSEKAFRGNVDNLLKLNKGMLETRNVFVRDIKKMCADFPKCNIILKPHPLEDFSFYKKINVKNFYMIKDITFNDTINSMDLAIHWCSTVAAECWVNGIKTLQYVPVVSYKSLLNAFDHENPVYDNYLDLKRGISKYLIHNLDKRYLLFQKKYLKLWFYKTDGLSVRRIALKIKEILRNTHSNTLNYMSVNSRMLYIFIIMEKILGIRISRMIVSLLKRDYNWRFAVNNFIFNAPINR